MQAINMYKYLGSGTSKEAAVKFTAFGSPTWESSDAYSRSRVLTISMPIAPLTLEVRVCLAVHTDVIPV